MPHWKRVGGWLALMAALLPAAAFVYRYRAMPHFGFLLDDAIYVTCARSLAEGAGYKIASLPGAPWQTKYPPGYSWMLSWIWSAAPAFPANLRWIAALGGLSLAAAVLLARRVGRDLGLDSRWAVAAAALCALNPPAIFYSASAMSDIPGLALMLASFVLMTEGARRHCVWLALAAGLVGAAAFLTRSAFLALLATAPAWFLWKRQWRGAAAFAAAMLPCVAGWQLWSRAHHSLDPSPQIRFYVDYLGYLSANFSAADIPAVAAANFQTLVQSAGRVLWFDPDAGALVSLWRTILLLLALAGVWRLSRRALHPYTIFAVLYSSILLPWNFSPNERFLLPLLPLLMAGLTESARQILDALRTLWRRGGLADRGFAGAVFAGLAVAVVLWASAFSQGLGYLRTLMEREKTRFAMDRAAGQWAGAYLPAGSTVVTHQESRFHLLSGLRAIGMPLPSKTGYGGVRKEITAYFDSVKDIARQRRARYLYVTPSSFELDLDTEERAAWLARIRADPEWREIFAMRGHSIFELGASATYSDIESR